MNQAAKTPIASSRSTAVFFRGAGVSKRVSPFFSFRVMVPAVGALYFPTAISGEDRHLARTFSSTDGAFSCPVVFCCAPIISPNASGAPRAKTLSACESCSELLGRGTARAKWRTGEVERRLACRWAKAKSLLRACPAPQPPDECCHRCHRLLPFPRCALATLLQLR